MGDQLGPRDAVQRFGFRVVSDIEIMVMLSCRSAGAGWIASRFTDLGEDSLHQIFGYVKTGLTQALDDRSRPLDMPEALCTCHNAQRADHFESHRLGTAPGLQVIDDYAGSGVMHSPPSAQSP